ncbi:MAG: family 2 glycosyl transferase [Rhodobacteraceae bacterium]|nr:MAG: family 2 glycosyl transferase [Paracoccaceae bacterium]
MKALMLTRYERSGASSRLRLIQYAGPLGLQGMSSSLQPFFDDNYLRRLYSGSPTLATTLVAYARRAGQLIRAGHADIMWLEKEALPWLPWALECAMLPRVVPLVVDYDDAVFHRYDLHPSAAVRRLLGRKLDRLMASASLVTAGNCYLADRAKMAGAQQVEIVPTVVDLTAYTLRPDTFSASGPTIGWIGTPSTWTEYMAPKLPLLTQAAEAAGGRIAAVGAGRAAAAYPLLDNLPWTEESEVMRIHEMDIGIMPLTDTPWARGKCGYKLIQYMACGIPVIASPVGVNAEIVEHGVNGLLASSDAEWAEALQTLLRDANLRARMGEAGRRKVERDYSLQVWGPRVAQMLRDVASTGKSR